MLLQSLLPIPLLLEEHKGVPCGSTIWLLHKQDAMIFVQDVARVAASVEEVDLARHIISSGLSGSTRLSLTTCLAVQS